MTESRELLRSLRLYQFNLSWGKAPKDPTLVATALDWFEEQNARQPRPSVKLHYLAWSLRKDWCRHLETIAKS